MLMVIRKFWGSSGIKARMFGSSSQDYKESGLADLQRFYEPSDDFFYRKEEMSKLSNLLKRKDKRIFFLTGPPNCGKSLLVKEMLKDLNQFVPITHNMRTMRVENSEDDNLISQLATSFNTHLTFMQHLKNAYSDKNETNNGINIKTSIPWIENIESYLHASPRVNPREITGKNFTKVLEAAIENYHKFIFLPSKINLVLFIDEFNKVRNEKDQEFVNSFLDFLVRKSKEENKLSVLLATTDSFLVSHFKENCNLKSGAYREFYLGWLSKEEVFCYLKMRKVPERFHEMIYEFHGGNILEINDLLGDGDETITEDQIIEYREERLSLDLPYISASNIILKPDEEKALIAIYKKLVKQDFVLRSDLDKEFGKDVVIELLRHNLLYSQRGYGLRKGERVTKGEAITLNAPSHKFAVADYLKAYFNDS